MSLRYQVVPAAYIVFRRGDRGEQVLLQLRRNTGYMDGYWAMAAAGHVEADESVLHAACREAHEELGISILPDDLVPLCGMHRTQRDHQPVNERADFFFECRRWSGAPQIMEHEKCAKLDWFNLDDLPDPVVPHELFVLEHLRNGGIPPVVAYGFKGREPASPDRLAAPALPRTRLKARPVDRPPSS